MSTHVSFLFYYTSTPLIYTLSLHDALPISPRDGHHRRRRDPPPRRFPLRCARARRRDRGHAVRLGRGRDRKSTRLNSSHDSSSYAVFSVKKKNLKRY